MTRVVVGGIRGFSQVAGMFPTHRCVDSDAPDGFRQELVDFVMNLAAETPSGEEHFHRVATQSIGQRVAGAPYAGYRHALGRDISKVDWIRVYDLIPRLAIEFDRYGEFEQFRIGVNRILAANSIAWDLDEDAQLIRVLPATVSKAFDPLFPELSREEFAATRALLGDAVAAYNARPQRSRDACANAFDAVESAAKVVLHMPSATMDAVLKECRSRGLLSAEVLRMLESLNIARHRHFGHGMADPFALRTEEVDLVYLNCLTAVMLFARLAL